MSGIVTPRPGKESVRIVATGAASFSAASAGTDTPCGVVTIVETTDGEGKPVITVSRKSGEVLRSTGGCGKGGI